MKKSIFIADDDEATIEILTHILHKQGYNVQCFTDAQKMLRRKTHLPDLIILDIILGAVDGREVCRQLKVSPITKHIPVLLISAIQKIEKHADDAKADDFLAKPFSKKSLLEKIEALINRNRHSIPSDSSPLQSNDKEDSVRMGKESAK